MTEKDTCVLVHESPVAVILSRLIRGLKIASPNIDNLVACSTTNLIGRRCTRERSKAVTSDKGEDSLCGPFPCAFILHLPGLDKLCTRRENMSIRDIIILDKGGNEG